jgi:hypothetical protein
MCSPAQVVSRRLVALAGEVEQRKPAHIRAQRTKDLTKLFKIQDDLGTYVCDATVAVVSRSHLQDAPPGSRANDVIYHVGSDRTPKSFTCEYFDTIRAVDSRFRLIVFTRGTVIADTFSGKIVYTGNTGSILSTASPFDMEFPALMRDASYPVLRLVILERQEWLLCSLRTYSGCTAETGPTGINRDYLVNAINSGSIN